MWSLIDDPDVAPAVTAVELAISAWCTCREKQSTNHYKLIVINYLHSLSIDIDLGVAKIKASEFCIQTLTT